MVNIKRWLKHAFMPPWSWRLSFPADVLDAIESAVKHSELQHRGELRFAIENALAPGMIWYGMSARRRAVDIFSRLRVWDTEENSGVLIYVNLADHCVQIIADRGIDRCVEQPEWTRIAGIMKNEFKQDNFKEGSLKGIEEITKLLVIHFPTTGNRLDELPNRPVIIRK